MRTTCIIIVVIYSCTHEFSRVPAVGADSGPHESASRRPRIRMARKQEDDAHKRRHAEGDSPSPKNPRGTESPQRDASCTPPRKRAEIPYHPICLGFFAQESPVPNRPLAPTTFPRGLSQACRHLSVQSCENRRQQVEKEQAELLALFCEAQREGAVMLLSRETQLS